MKYQTHYFDQSGPGNTGATLDLVQEWTEMLDLKTVLVASTTGETGVLALKKLKFRNVVVVSHSTGFKRENEQEFDSENRNQIQALGGKILTCQHALAGVSRAIRLKFNTYTIDELIANTLRIFGQGMKVAVEIALMAADAGLIHTDEDVISVGGTGRGADTAAVIKPANVARFFDLKVRGILCKPWTC
jgi:hypothetical protein